MPAIPLPIDSVVQPFGDLTAVSGVSLQVGGRRGWPCWSAPPSSCSCFQTAAPCRNLLLR